MDQPVLTISPSNETNEDDAVVFTCIVKGSGLLEYKWFKNGNLIKEGGYLMVLNNVKRDQAGIYHCKVTNHINQKNSNSVSLNIKCK